MLLEHRRSTSFIFNDKVVVRVVIIGNEAASLVIANKLNLVNVDRVKSRDNSLAINLNHSLGGADCGGCELRIDGGVNSNVATDTDQVNAMRAALRLTMGMVRTWQRLTELLLVHLLNRLRACEIVAIVQFCLSTVQEFLAVRNHIEIERKLLAVKL